MNAITVVLIAAAVIIILAAAALIKAKNRFVILKNRVIDQEKQIDVQLKRRYDLIPNLIETAKGYANFEKSVLENVTNARTAAMQSKTFKAEMESNNALNQALSRFAAVGEAYPELKANQNFLQLQKELSETENKITMARQFFNDTVMKYNNAIQVFPASIAASMLGYKAFEYFEAAEQEKDNVRVTGDTFKI